MKKQRKIVLSIPHSSTLMPGCNGWEDCDQTRLSQANNLYTDIATDRLFAPNRLNADSVVCHRFAYSRLYCDAERLVDDVMETEGLGITYTEYMGLKRNLTDDIRRRAYCERAKYLAALCNDLTENDTLLIDCHSFTPDHGNDDIDICIGFNDDWSKPDDDTLIAIRTTFEGYGYRVAFNYPYSNSLTPLQSGTYHSVMIEVNKWVYLNEDMLTPNDKFDEVNDIINGLYGELMVM